MGRRRTRPDDPAVALLDAVRVPGVQRVSVRGVERQGGTGEIDLNLQLVYPLTTSLGLIGTW